MRLLFVIGAFLALFNNSEGKADYDTYDKYRQLIRSQGVINWKRCTDRDVVFAFRESLYSVTVDIYKKLAEVSNSHFVFSANSLWRTLVAIAEGTTGQTRAELKKFLRLPQDECLRKQFYQLVSTLEPPGSDVTLTRSSMVIFDEKSSLNGNWDHFVRSMPFLQTSSAPLKDDPVAAADLIRRAAKLQLPTAIFEGNSVIVDTLDFEGLWTDAFSDAVIERAPFYDDSGKKVGYVDLMKIRKRVKMTYNPVMNCKIVELPVGFQGRYRMLIGMSLGKTDVRNSISVIQNSVVFDILDSLNESIIPLEVAIPRFRMTSEIDIRTIMEDLGVKALWNDVSGTTNISEPAALPSSFIQRTTITLDTTGVRAPIQEVSNIVPLAPRTSAQLPTTGLDPKLGRSFIVDRPFLFGLLDSKTSTCLFCASFATPTYKIDAD